MRTSQQEIDERAKLAGNNKFELLLFRLGESSGSGQPDLFGLNVFKVREVLVMPAITELANVHAHLMGIANIRGQIILVINLPEVVGCSPKNSLSILMVTEFGRTVQAFAVKDVREIVRLEWDQVLPAEGNYAGALITGIARLELDVEQILITVMPATQEEINREVVGPVLIIPEGPVILAADDSIVARSVIELGLKTMGVKYIMTKTGKEAWERRQTIRADAVAEGQPVRGKVVLVLTDLEMPELDGFTPTRRIQQDARFKLLPVVIHSSLTGTTNENHVKAVGADAYAAKFVPRELATTMRSVLPGP